MSGVPQWISEEIADHLDAIGKLFKNPKMTLVIRIPEVPDGGVMMGNDNPENAIQEINKLIIRPEKIV